MSVEKGPISASVVLYFQRDDAARKLVFIYLFIYFYGLLTIIFFFEFIKNLCECL